MRSPKAGTRPWLRRKDWASRRLVSGMTDGVATGLRSFGYLVMLVFVPIVVLFLGALGYVIVFHVLKGVGPVTQAVAVGSILAVAVGVWKLTRTDPGRQLRRIGTPLKRHHFGCQLRTLPGVVGGWFKAEVEIDVPTGSEKPITATLTCLLARYTWSSARHAWSATYRVPAKLEPFGTASFRMSLPIVFFIPADILKHGRVQRSFLSVAVEAPDDFVYRGSFEVPIFDTSAAPSHEQHPEPAPTPVIELQKIRNV